MLNHFIRRQKKVGISTKIDSVSESLVLESFPNEKVVTLDEAFYYLEGICKKNQEKFPNRKTFENLVQLLVQKRFIIELTSQKLEKLLDTL